MTPLVIPAIDFSVIGPVIAIAVSAFVLMMVAVFAPKDHALQAAIAIVGIAVAILLEISIWNSSRISFSGSVIADSKSAFFGTIILVTAALGVLLSYPTISKGEMPLAEYYALLLFSVSGGLLLVQARDLIVVLIGLEVLSLALYVLSAYSRSRVASEESALKYFLLGSFAFCFLVYGTALLFGSTGSTDYTLIARELSSGFGVIASAGIGLILVGFAFKLSFVPFHMWTPDVYTGAPTPVTGIMSVMTKVAAFGALYRLLSEALPAASSLWIPVIWALAMLTMVWGNIAAIVQTDIKRMLAYSSIGQAGYVLIALVSVDQIGASALMFYVLSYAFVNLGAFAVATILAGPNDENISLAAFTGLGRSRPVLALAMTLFLLGLAGVPPTSGFLAKLYAFWAAISAGYVSLAIVGVLTSAAATFFYLYVIARMFFQPAVEGVSRVPEYLPRGIVVILVVCAFATLALGIIPAPALDVVQASSTLIAR